MVGLGGPVDAIVPMGSSGGLGGNSLTGLDSVVGGELFWMHLSVSASYTSLDSQFGGSIITLPLTSTGNASKAKLLGNISLLPEVNKKTNKTLQIATQNILIFESVFLEINEQGLEIMWLINLNIVIIMLTWRVSYVGFFSHRSIIT